MSIFERLIKVFHAVFENDVDVSNITETSALREDVGINSIGMLYMAMAVEEEFNVKFQNEDFAQIKTVGDYKVKCKLGYEVVGTINVVVVEEK